MIFYFVISVLVCYIVYKYLTNDPEAPDGPKGYPLIGYMPSLTRSHIELTEWSKIYGNVYSYNSFGTRIYVISGISAIKEAFIKNGDNFVERIAGRNKMIMDNRGGNYGLLISYGNLWKEQRRFSLSALRDLGFGKPIMENAILDEGEYLIEQLLKPNGESTDIQFTMTKAISNIISKLIFGNRFSYNDEQVFALIKKINDQAGGTNLVVALGLLKYTTLMPIFHTRFKKNRQLAKQILHQLAGIIEKTKEQFCAISGSSSYIDSFLIEQHNTDNNEKRVGFEDQQLLVATNDLFGAGTETTSTTLRWALLLCALYPEYQERLHQEIKETIGLDTTISYADRNKLPVIEAFLLEVQRFACLVPVVVRTGIKWRWQLACKQIDCEDKYIGVRSAATTLRSCHSAQNKIDQYKPFDPLVHDI